MNSCIVYLLSPINPIDVNYFLMDGDKRFDMAKASLKNVTKVLNLPVIIFHEDFTNKEKEIMKNIYTNITFEKVDFVRPDLPFHQTPCKTSGLVNCTCNNPTVNPNYTCFRQKGYLMMCRFFSGKMQNHPALQKYDSYFRFDDDSFFINPIIDQNNFLKQFENLDYGFRSLFHEHTYKHDDLLQYTIEFCKKNKLDISNISRQFMKNNKYSGLAPYNNFHFSKLSLWKHPIIIKYIEEIDKVNGYLLKGWLDANIHAMIIFLLCPVIGLKCNVVTNFGYRHNKHFSRLNDIYIDYKTHESFYPK